MYEQPRLKIMHVTNLHRTSDFCPRCKFQERNFNRWLDANQETLADNHIIVSLAELDIDDHLEAMQEVGFQSAPVWAVTTQGGRSSYAGVCSATGDLTAQLDQALALLVL